MSIIAIDYTPAYEQGGGIGRYVRELIQALAQQDTQTPYRLFVSGIQNKLLPPVPGANFIWSPTRISPAWLARIWHRARIPLPIEFFTGRVGLYHATDFVLPPTLPKTPTLLTVHDLSFVRVPETASPRLKTYLDRVVPRSVKRADHILADSQATKDDLVALYNTPPEKITVLLSAVSAHFQRTAGLGFLLTIRKKYGVPDAPYIYANGTIQPRKNYTRLIYALAALKQAGSDVHLVISGGRGWLEDPIYAAVEETHMQPYVHMIGFVDDKDLPILYSHAVCLVFASLYEGFGLPILEAMACGTPVITSNISSLPEVAGDAALLVNPYQLDEIIHALQRILNDSVLRETLISKGFEQVKRFSWETSAKQLRQIYTHLL